MGQDFVSTLEGQSFIWDQEKAWTNVQKHGVTFERAREVFFDQLARYYDAAVDLEQRSACIGLARDMRLLYVVHALREGGFIRIISARMAERPDRRLYEDDE